MVGGMAPPQIPSSDGNELQLAYDVENQLKP